MTQKKKAELQRKLSIAPVVKPPAGLADRIKADIPEYLRTENDRERLSRSVAFNLRVAASILLVVTSAFLAIRLLSPESAGTLRSVAKGTSPSVIPAAAEKKEEVAEVTVTMTESVPTAAFEMADAAAPAPKPAPARVVAPVAQVASAESDQRQLGRRERLSVGGAVSSRDSALPAPPAAPLPAPPPPEPPAVVAESAVQAEGITVTSAAPVATAAAAPPPPAPAPSLAPTAVPVAPPAGASNETAKLGSVSRAPAAGFIRSAQAADLRLQTPRSLFDVSINPSEFDRLRRMIESQRQPDASTIDVEALVNHFAGSTRPRRDVAVQVEASPAPLPDGGTILRVTIDTASHREDGGSLPPVGSDANLTIELDDAAVSSHTVVGAGSLIANEPVLLKGTSVTRLVEMSLRPNLKPRQHVAKITLRYKSVVSGKEVTLPYVITAADVRKSWTDSSRRHRLATLGAVWGASLKDAAAGEEVARKAEKLSSEEPEDATARDLAAAASASSRLRSSAPTGSGR